MNRYESVNIGILELGAGINGAAFTVANAPDPAEHTGGVIYVSDGAAGAPVLAFSDGTNWLRSDTLAAIAIA